MDEKRCSHCNQYKSTNEFSKNRCTADGLQRNCKVCTKQVSRDYRERKKKPPEKEVIPQGFKKCPQCQTVKAWEEFHNSKQRKDGKYPYCKECKGIEALRMYTERKENNVRLSSHLTKECITRGNTLALNGFPQDINVNGGYSNVCKDCRKIRRQKRTEVRGYIPKSEKRCPKCGEMKSSEDYNFSRHTTDGKASYCRTCVAPQIREWYQNNKEKSRLYKAMWVKRNPQQRQEVRIRWVNKNKNSGLCTCCLEPRMPYSSLFCEYHYYANAASNNLGTARKEVALALRQKLIDQDFRCPYTGTKLVLGKNTAVDHIYPRSRFPHLGKELSNVEWVRRDVNFAKFNLTPDEFIALCNGICDYTEGEGVC